MKTLAFTFRADLEFSQPVSAHQFALRCIPADGDGQRLQSLQISLEPQTKLYRLRDGFGNTMLCGTLAAPHGRFCYCAEGAAAVEPAWRLPVENGPQLAVYRTPGLLTRPDAALQAYAARLPLAGKDDRQKALLLCSAVGQRLRYLPGATTNATTAAQAFALGAGVCQDYANLFLALARLSGLTARYCMGLALGEGATHAWAEVLLPGGWTIYDPTRSDLPADGYLRFAVGRDAADCPAERGVFRGSGSQTQTVAMVLRERT